MLPLHAHDKEFRPGWRLKERLSGWIRYFFHQYGMAIFVDGRVLMVLVNTATALTAGRNWGSLPNRTATKSTLICFYSVKNVTGINISVAVDGPVIAHCTDSEDFPTDI